MRPIIVGVTKELPADGESVSFELTSGDYVVGVHIPEGNYQADVSYDYDTVQVDDWDSGFYLYEYAGRTDGDYLDDLRLYNGAIVHISSQTTITLYSDNAQTENILYENNPLAGLILLPVVIFLTPLPGLSRFIWLRLFLRLLILAIMHMSQWFMITFTLVYSIIFIGFVIV